jgi:hypothetical protein
MTLLGIFFHLWSNGACFISLKASRDSVSTETMGIQFELKNCATYQFYTCKVVRQKFIMCQTGCFSMKNSGGWISLYC